VGAIKRVLLWSAIAVLGGRLVILYLIPAWNSIVTDFPNYYTAAWAVRHGDPLSDLYDPVWFEREKHHAGIERPAALFNYFPPINALVMWPLANLSPIGAKRAWTVLNMVALGAVILLTVKATGIGFLPAMAIALLGGDALGNNLAYGQFYIVLTLLLLALLEQREASSEPVPPSKWDDHIDELEKQALDDAFKKHIGQLFSIWVTDRYEPRIPPKALTGARNARDAYIRSMEAIEKRELPPRRN